jgi:hypothetical protein
MVGIVMETMTEEMEEITMIAIEETMIVAAAIIEIIMIETTIIIIMAETIREIEMKIAEEETKKLLKSFKIKYNSGSENFLLKQ